MEERQEGSRRPSWWTLTLPAVTSSAAWVTQVYFSDRLPAITQASLVTIGVLASALTVLLPALELRSSGRRSAGRDRSLRSPGRGVRAGRDAAEPDSTAGQPVDDHVVHRLAAYKIAIVDMLIPLALAVTDVLTTTGAAARREARQSLRQLTVGFAAERVGPGRSRSCFYALETSPGTGERTLRLRAWHGRHTPPRPRFDPSDPQEAQAFALVDSLDSMLVPDVQETYLPGWTGVAEYRTFIAVTVSAGETPLGLLTLDSLHPGDLSQEDLDLVRLFAQLLAAGLAVR